MTVTMEEIKQEDQRLIGKLLSDLRVQDATSADEAVIQQFIHDIVENRFRKFKVAV
jgi:hypothetical protein